MKRGYHRLVELASRAVEHPGWCPLVLSSGGDAATGKPGLDGCRSLGSMTGIRPIQTSRKDKQREMGSPLLLPKAIQRAELRLAWTRAGRAATEFYGLPGEVCEALRHPFTLHAFLGLREKTAMLPSSLASRYPRGVAESPARCRSRPLRTSDTRPLSSGSPRHCSPAGWVCHRFVECGRTETDVPRFDPAQPPGLAVERLIASNIIQTVPDHQDRIRFSLEAVGDYFLAENEVKQIASDQAKVLQVYRH